MKKIQIILFSFIQFLLLLPLIASASFQTYPNLEYGVTDSSVSELQKFLNKNGYVVNQISGEEGSIDHESNYFGKLTRAALSRFQKDQNIEPSNGYFGEKTKTKFDLLATTVEPVENFLSASETNYSEEINVNIVDLPILKTISTSTPTTKNTSDTRTTKSASRYYTFNTYSSVNGSKPVLVFSQQWPHGTNVQQLVGSDNKIYSFSSFGGDCSYVRLRGNCVLFMNSDKNVIINWKAKTYTLEMKDLGSDGSGTINPKKNTYIANTEAIVMAKPNKNSEILWFKQPRCVDSNDCTILMDKNKTVEYMFRKVQKCTQKSVDNFKKAQRELKQITEKNKNLQIEISNLENKVNKTNKDKVQLSESEKELSKLKKESERIKKYMKEISCLEQSTL
jgi:peptidoglycan hydrolase-like protein with peptidoglycan-binding domain